MERLLESAYRTLRAAYDKSFAAYQLVDTIWSVAWAAVKYGGGAILGLLLAIGIQVGTVYCVFRCFFPGPKFRDQDRPLDLLFPSSPVISAFIFFAGGESGVVIIIFFILDSLFNFKLNFLLGSRPEDAEGQFSPIGDGTTDSADDELTF